MPVNDPVDVVVCEAVSAALAAKTFSGTITSCPAVYREYVDPDGESFETLQAFVSPGEMEVEEETRGADVHTVMVQILIGKRCQSDADKRAMRVLRTQIVDMIRSGTLPATTPALPQHTVWRRLRTMEAPGRQLLGMDVWICAIAAEYSTLIGK